MSVTARSSNNKVERAVRGASVAKTLQLPIASSATENVAPRGKILYDINQDDVYFSSSTGAWLPLGTVKEITGEFSVLQGATVRGTGDYVLRKTGNVVTLQLDGTSGTFDAPAPCNITLSSYPEEYWPSAFTRMGASVRHNNLDVPGLVFVGTSGNIGLLRVDFTAEAYTPTFLAGVNGITDCTVTWGV